MRVMVLVKASRASEAGALPGQQILAEMGRFNEELSKAGVLLAGEGLKPTSQGARLRWTGNKRSLIDGPFTETKELVAGFWLWKVASMEDALHWAKRCPKPHEEDCEIEIRPLFEMDDFGENATPEIRQQEERTRKRAEELRSRT